MPAPIEVHFWPTPNGFKVTVMLTAGGDTLGNRNSIERAGVRSEVFDGCEVEVFSPVNITAVYSQASIVRQPVSSSISPLIGQAPHNHFF